MQKLAAKHERTDLPAFAPGDTIRVQVKIKEGEKERLQAFEGMVIACRRRPPGNLYRPQNELRPGRRAHLPLQLQSRRQGRESIRSYQVRRSKLFYLRGLRGKAARLREVERKVVAKA